MDIQIANDFDKTEDISFAISVLNKRRRELSNNFPLAMKIVSAIRTLVEIKASIDESGDITDLSDCDEDTKAQILENAEILDAIERQKRADNKNSVSDVEMQVKHGRWVDEYEGLPFCSVCDYNGYGHLMPPYCPNCGAKMDLDKEDL